MLPDIRLPGSVFPIPLLAAAWVFVTGNLKRVRDLRMSEGKAATLVGIWATAMVAAAVIAAGLLLMGVLSVMGNGGPDGGALMVYSVLVFLAPIVVAPLLLGFVPGGPDS